MSQTPDEIAAQIAREFFGRDMAPEGGIRSLIAAALTAERDRAEKAEADLTRARRAREKAEVERDEAVAQAAAHEAKWQTLCQRTHGTCACSYDHKDDVCAYHSPKLAEALARAEKAEAEALGLRAKCGGCITFDERIDLETKAREAALREAAEVAERHEAYYRARDRGAMADASGGIADDILALIPSKEPSP